MSLLIKGMEMPKTGEYRCVIRQWKRGEPLTMDLYGEEELCGTITTVPPHGRLGDLDELEVKHMKVSGDYSHGYYKSTWDYVCAARELIRNAPTIIPADDEHTMEEFMCGQEGNLNDGSM